MKRLCSFATVLVSLLVLSSSAFAQAPGTEVYNNLPTPMPPNVPSLGFQATSTREFGDEIRLEPLTPRRAGFATVLMSTWSLNSTYPSMPAAGYQHPITLSIYADQTAALADDPLARITKTFTIPWRPEPDAACGTRWKADDGQCYSGKAFTIDFDLRPLNLQLPDQFIFGVAYNTNTWGRNPLNAPGPYESLNVGTSPVTVASAGEDVVLDVAYWNTSYAGFYADDGTNGVGVFRPDTDWTGFAPAVSFTTLAVPTSGSECKNGAWQNLIRVDSSLFKNQGACVAYVNTGK